MRRFFIGGLLALVGCAGTDTLSEKVKSGKTFELHQNVYRCELIFDYRRERALLDEAREAAIRYDAESVIKFESANSCNHDEI